MEELLNLIWTSIVGGGTGAGLVLFIGQKWLGKAIEHEFDKKLSQFSTVFTRRHDEICKACTAMWDAICEAHDAAKAFVRSGQRRDSENGKAAWTALDGAKNTLRRYRIVFDDEQFAASDNELRELDRVLCALDRVVQYRAISSPELGRVESDFRECCDAEERAFAHVRCVFQSALSPSAS